jgi:hypothetical protein
LIAQIACRQDPLTALAAECVQRTSIKKAGASTPA